MNFLNLLILGTIQVRITLLLPLLERNVEYVSLLFSFFLTIVARVGRKFFIHPSIYPSFIHSSHCMPGTWRWRNPRQSVENRHGNEKPQRTIIGDIRKGYKKCLGILKKKKIQLWLGKFEKLNLKSINRRKEGKNHMFLF